MDSQTLVLVDIQRGFRDATWGKRNNPHFETNVSQLLRHWRSKKWPIIHVRHDSILASSPLRCGHIGNEFMECAEPLPNEPVISKAVNSAFIGTNLSEMLLNAKAKHLVFAGLTTDHCISTSTRMAANLGFSATVVSDATATFARQDSDGQSIDAETVHRVSLASLRDEFSIVACTKQLLTA
jgi:nicotinamidase-related amidase